MATTYKDLSVLSSDLASILHLKRNASFDSETSDNLAKQINSIIRTVLPKAGLTDTFKKKARSHIYSKEIVKLTKQYPEYFDRDYFRERISTFEQQYGFRPLKSITRIDHMRNALIYNYYVLSKTAERELLHSWKTSIQDIIDGSVVQKTIDKKVVQQALSHPMSKKLRSLIKNHRHNAVFTDTYLLNKISSYGKFPTSSELAASGIDDLSDALAVKVYMNSDSDLVMERFASLYEDLEKDLKNSPNYRKTQALHDSYVNLKMLSSVEDIVNEIQTLVLNEKHFNELISTANIPISSFKGIDKKDLNARIKKLAEIIYGRSNITRLKVK
jgi:hypothetical protein